MPFAASEYDHAFSAFLGEVVSDLARGRSPMLSMIQHETSSSTVASRIRDREGLEVDMPERAVGFEMTFDIEKIRAGDPTAFAVEADRASEELARELVGMVVSSIGTITEATGNVVRSKTGDIDFETMHTMLEGIEMSLDENDELVLPVLVMGPGQAAKLDNLPPLTAEQRTKMDALKARKREELLARRLHRRLS